MRFLVSVTYDGSVFAGWQKQQKCITVQGEIEKALTKINKEAIRIYGSGRTDAGVHAIAQTFHYDSVVNMNCEQVKRALNTLLNRAIRIIEVVEVAPDFHARFDVLSKTYIYKINCGDFVVFDRNYVLQYNRPIDISRLRMVSEYFIGTHDFTAFNATPVEEIQDQVRTITNFEIKEKENLIIFEITGDGFLRYMIRILVATCLAFHNNLISLETIKNALVSGDKSTIPYNIDSCGLYLSKVTYKCSNFLDTLV